MGHGLAEELPRLLSLLIGALSTPTFAPDELKKLKELKELKELVLGGLLREKTDTFSQSPQCRNVV